MFVFIPNQTRWMVASFLTLRRLYTFEKGSEQGFFSFKPVLKKKKFSLNFFVQLNMVCKCKRIFEGYPIETFFLDISKYYWQFYCYSILLVFSFLLVSLPTTNLLVLRYNPKRIKLKMAFVFFLSFYSFCLIFWLKKYFFSWF